MNCPTCPVYVCVCGILNWPGSSKNWNGRAVTWLHNHQDCQAEKVDYLCGPVGRAFGQNDRVQKLYGTLTSGGNQPSYASTARRIVLVGHSNGCAVIQDCLREHGDLPPIEALHLVCAASDSDFNTNGLNRLLGEGKVGSVTVYMAGRDQALHEAASFLGVLLGYGHLGLEGPKNVLQSVQDRVRIVRMAPWDAYGHSDCWHDDNFEKTMGNFLAP